MSEIKFKKFPWVKDTHKNIPKSGDSSGPYMVSAAAPLYAIPEGYALVPVEPTQRMVDSCRHGFMVLTEDTQWNDFVKGVYKEMIKAGVLGL